MNKTIKNKKMNKTFLFIPFLLVVLFVISSCATDDNQTVARFTQLVMQDEFETDDFIDTSIWSYDIGNGEGTIAGMGWGNNELQYYTNRPENAVVQNGVLIISAIEESFQGSNYTSARLLTKGKFEQTYGRFEARIKLPSGQGMWPAFWLLGANIQEGVEDPDDPTTLPWPECGEIDIMENRGNEPTLVSGAVHGPGYSGGEFIGKSYELENDRYDTGFHIFGIEWGPEYINYYVDDVLYNQITPADVTGDWVYDHPFFIIINLAVGGDFGGAPDAETVFPQTMLVDYVRVYKKN